MPKGKKKTAAAPPAHRGRVVLAPSLLLGSRETVNDAAFLNQHGVTHLLTCAKELPRPSSVESGKLPLHRAALEESLGAELLWPTFRAGVEWGLDALRSGGVLLVYCRHGVNRSVATLCGILLSLGSEAGGVATVEEALAAVLQVQPKAMPQPALRICLRWLSEGGAPSTPPPPLVDDVADASAGSASCEQSTAARQQAQQVEDSVHRHEK